MATRPSNKPCSATSSRDRLRGLCEGFPSTLRITSLGETQQLQTKRHRCGHSRLVLARHLRPDVLIGTGQSRDLVRMLDGLTSGSIVGEQLERGGFVV